MGFAQYSDRIADLTPGSIDLPPGMHPFPTDHAYRNTSLMFNIADYARQLTTDYLIAGGKIETVEFHTPSDLAALPQQIIVTAPAMAPDSSGAMTPSFPSAVRSAGSSSARGPLRTLPPQPQRSLSPGRYRRPD